MRSYFTVLLIPVFAVFFSMQASQAFAVADFSGHWIANSGKVSSNIPGLSANCSRVEIVIEQNEHALITRRYETDCQLFSTHWGPVQEDIQGTQVLEQGEIVGSISDDTLMTTSPSGTAAYAFNLKLIHDSQGSVILKSYYGTKTAVGAMATEADLHRVAE